MLLELIFPTLQVIALVVASSVFIIWGYQRWHYECKKIRHPQVQAASGYPIIGNLFDFQRSSSYQTLLRYPALYGPFVEFTIATVHGILITDATIGKEVLLRRPKKFSRPSVFDYGNIALSLHTGLFNANGSLWNRIRKATSPSFSILNITSKLLKINEEMLAWMERLHHELQLQQAKAASPNKEHSFDMKYEAFTLTIRTITAVAFGLDTTTTSSSSSSSASSASVCNEYFFSKVFKEDVEKMFRFMREVGMFGFPRWCWKYSSQYQHEILGKEANDRFTQACSIIIQEKREYWRRCSPQRGSLPDKELPASMLDSLLAQESSDKDSQTDITPSASSSKLANDEELIANVKTFYLAGTDTTAVTITWLTYYCALYPDYLKEIREEAARVLFPEITAFLLNDHQAINLKEAIEAIRGILRSITLNRVKEMHFTNAVIKETLRLKCPVAAISVEVATPEEDGEVANSVTLSNGITIPPGVMVWINQDAIHRLPEIFEDPLTFRPHRWLKKDEETEAAYLLRLDQMEAHFLPFGSGPRICPGMNLAIYEAVLAIGYLATFYQIKLACPVEEIVRVPNFVATPTKMPIIFTPL